MILPLLLAIFALTSAAPLVEEPHEKKTVPPLTVEAFDGYVGLLNMFKEMLPKQVMETLNGLNGTEKAQIVSFITDWFQDKIVKPVDKEGIVALIKEKLPAVYEKIDNLNTTFYGKFNALKPETQAMLRSWRDKAVSVEGTTPAESAGKQLQLVQEFGHAIQNLDAETKEDLRAQFPSAVKLTEGFGFTVITTVAMILQKITDSLTPPVQSVAPQECALPLDK